MDSYNVYYTPPPLPQGERELIKALPYKGFEAPEGFLTPSPVLWTPSTQGIQGRSLRIAKRFPCIPQVAGDVTSLRGVSRSNPAFLKSEW